MGRAAPCEPCVSTGVCTQYGPISAWNADDWEVSYILEGDPTTTAAVTFGTDLEITATIGSGPLLTSNLDRGITVVLRSKTLTYRHYRHHLPISLFTAKCELEIDNPFHAQTNYVQLWLQTGAGGVGPMMIQNAFKDRQTRRVASVVTGPTLPNCGPAYEDYAVELRFKFYGNGCQQGQNIVTKMGSLEFRIGSNCESYLAQPPGNDALHCSYTWSGMGTGHLNYAEEPPDCDYLSVQQCRDCADLTTIDVSGDMIEDDAGVELGISSVIFSDCPNPFGSELFFNARFYFSFRLAWDSDLAQWCVFHRGRYFLSGKSDYLSAADSPLVLNADPSILQRGAAVIYDPECPNYAIYGPYRCYNNPTEDLCSNFPLTLSIPLASI